MTVGVARQHAGITGQIENCQTVGFTAYVTGRGHAASRHEQPAAGQYQDAGGLTPPVTRDTGSPGITRPGSAVETHDHGCDDTSWVTLASSNIRPGDSMVRQAGNSGGRLPVRARAGGRIARAIRRPANRLRTATPGDTRISEGGGARDS